MASVKANIKRFRAEQAQRHPRHTRPSLPKRSPSTIVKMAQSQTNPEDYTTRSLDQEIDAVAICPAHNDYMIIGTYSLIKKDDPTEYAGQSRRGSLRVMTVSSTFKPSYAGMLAPQLDKVDFPCAVLDIHFHPSDPTLLGAATSNGLVYFFRFVVHGDVLGRRVVTSLLPVGTVRAAADDEHGLTPLITQFTWFDKLGCKGTKGVDDVLTAALAVTTTFGETRVIKVSIPAIRDQFDVRQAVELEPPVFSCSETIHKHDLEAWTVATVDLDTHPGVDTRLILSGGDDSALVSSSITPASPQWPPYQPADSNGDGFNAMPLWRDRRNHTAGVVSILPLTPPPIPDMPPTTKAEKSSKQHRPIPLLTGSYDENIRLFEIDPKIYRATPKTDLGLGGGVWRLQLLDTYPGFTTGPSSSHHDKSTDKPEERTHWHYLILASLMHAGAAILRVTYTTLPPSPSTNLDGEWSIAVVKRFTAGHESMVYSCDAKLQDLTQMDDVLSQDSKEAAGRRVEIKWKPVYTVVSTSFYDMKVCTWTFVDKDKGRV